MSTSGSSAKNSHVTQGGRTTMKPMPVNRIKYCPWINLQLWNFCHSFLSFTEWVVFLDNYVLLYNTCLYRSLRRHGHHCHSSPLTEVRIPPRAAVRAHFLVIKKGAGQLYLSFDTRYLTILIPFSWIGSNVQYRKAVDDALQYIKMYAAGVWTQNAKVYFKNVEEQVIRRQSKVWNNI